MRKVIEKLELYDSLLSTKGTFVCSLTVFVVIVFSALFNIIENSIGVGLLTFLTIVVAISKYVSEKEKQRKNEIIDLISFFREEVIGQHNIFGDKVREVMENPKHKFVKIHLEEFSIEWLRNNRSAMAKKQMDYVLEGGIQPSGINTLNTLEEFAAKVKILNATEVPELEILHPSFVGGVEDLAVLILAERELGPGETMFRNTVDLYMNWSKRVDRQTFEQKKDSLNKRLGIKK